MKKLLFSISVVVLGLVSCQSHTTLVQKSDVTIMTPDSTHLWILNGGIGNIIYEQWTCGAFGDRTKVYLVDATEFSQLSKKAKKF